MRHCGTNTNVLVLDHHFITTLIRTIAKGPLLVLTPITNFLYTFPARKRQLEILLCFWLSHFPEFPEFSCPSHFSTKSIRRFCYFFICLSRQEHGATKMDLQGPQLQIFNRPFCCFFDHPPPPPGALAHPMTDMVG